MNKKVLIGCLIAFVVVAIAASVLLYFFVIKPASQYVASLGEISEVAKLDENIQNQESYSPPTDDLLTQEQVDRFLRVQSHIESSLGTRSEELKEKYKRFSEGQEPGFGEILQILKDLGGLIRDAKEFQVEGLNQEDFSIEEYKWVRNQIYSALGTSVANLNLDRVVEAVQTQNPDILTQQPEETSTPDANRELVEAHRDELMKSLAFVWIGL